VDEVMVIPRDSVPPTPLTLRQSRRVAVNRSLRAAAAGAAAVATWWPLRLTWLPWVLALGCLAGAAGVLRAGTGRVEIDAEGIRVTRFGRSRRLAWSSIDRCAVRSTLWGRSVQVSHSGGRRLRLPVPVSPYLAPDPAFDSQIEAVGHRLAGYRAAGAPELTRSGTGPYRAGRPRPRQTPAPAMLGNRRRCLLAVSALLLGALLLDQPWGWSDGPVAVAVPDPCPLAAGRATAMTGPVPQHGGTERLPAATVARACEWDVTPQRWLLVSVQRYGRWGLHSATWRATVAYAGLRRNLEGGRVSSAPRLGDESIVSAVDGGAAIVARRGNVLVTAIARQGLPHYDSATMLAMVRAVVDAIVLRGAG
jgi:hypothetical protein